VSKREKTEQAISPSIEKITQKGARKINAKKSCGSDERRRRLIHCGHASQG
jgi:hypothetical protein